LDAVIDPENLWFGAVAQLPAGSEWHDLSATWGKWLGTELYAQLKRSRGKADIARRSFQYR
jgi:hypothetical protein